MENKLANWQKGKAEELKFWDTWLSSKGGHWKESGYDWTEDFRTRMDPESVLQDYVADEIRARKMTDPKILDLCAGPLTILNKTMDGKRLDITAVDALAIEYMEMLNNYCIIPEVITHFGEAEKFRLKEYFDVIHCSNGLDHSYDPFTAILNLSISLKRRGIMILKHFIKEGERGNYGGLHQWNFFERDGCFIISDAKGSETNVTNWFGPQYLLNVKCITKEKELLTYIWH